MCVNEIREQRRSQMFEHQGCHWVEGKKSFWAQVLHFNEQQHSMHAKSIYDVVQL